ncbi:MAG: diaminopimelate epimerase [Acidimicrobiales bacterium]|nr:diaminopimelate epimerase [Acidimicrobiales bacterium]
MTASSTSAAGRLHLTKHHGLGNDFLVAIVEDPARYDCPVLAKRLCDRRRGIGADGLIITSFTAGNNGGADATMALHNADGSRAEMSGNGIRCLAQALAMARGTASIDLTIATDAGPRRVQVRPHRGDAATVDVRVAMGSVTAGPAWTPGPAARAALAELGVREADGGGHHHAETADIGNPHLVVEVADPAQVEVARLGPVLEADFPAGVNVQFIAAEPEQPDRLTLTVWERGAGVTEACGTGASAAATVAHRWGLVGPEVTVSMPGGTVSVVVGAAGTELVGPATFIAHLEVDHG